MSAAPRLIGALVARQPNKGRMMKNGSVLPLADPRDSVKALESAPFFLVRTFFQTACARALSIFCDPVVRAATSRRANARS